MQYRLRRRDAPDAPEAGVGAAALEHRTPRIAEAAAPRWLTVARTVAPRGVGARAAAAPVMTLEAILVGANAPRPIVRGEREAEATGATETSARDASALANPRLSAVMAVTGRRERRGDGGGAYAVVGYAREGVKV